MKSVFTDKESVPDDESLKVSLGTTYEFWQTFVDYVPSVYPKSVEEWSFSKSGGWSFRIKDSRRAIIYLLPRDGFFKAAFVFGQKAADEVFKSEVAIAIKTELESAKAYAEGRGIRIEVKDGKIINDIKNLINIKLEN
ncbi:MAG: DUF3788 domain-containing protein [Tannerella sp.]|jgi:hypothetical protein|nr:DUF3788 domain-containing protein [Tannerella sp.]